MCVCVHACAPYTLYCPSLLLPPSFALAISDAVLSYRTLNARPIPYREDGTFVGTATDEDGTLMNAGLAAEALGALIALGGKNVDTSAITSSIGATYEALGEKIVDSVEEERTLGPASLALSSLVSLLKAVKAKHDVGIDCTSAVASLIMSLKTTASPYEAYNLLSAVAAISNGPSQQPVVVEAITSRIVSGKSKGAAYKVKLSDIQGKEVPAAKITSAKLAASSDGEEMNPLSPLDSITLALYSRNIHLCCSHSLLSLSLSASACASFLYPPFFSLSLSWHLPPFFSSYSPLSPPLLPSPCHHQPLSAFKGASNSHSTPPPLPPPPLTHSSRHMH